MAEKLGSGSWHEGGPGPDDTPVPVEPQRAEEDRLIAKRNAARWTGVMGFAMLFAGRLLGTAILLGGGLMALYGAVVSMYWSRRLRKLKGDPWAYDPELDGPRMQP